MLGGIPTFKEDDLKPNVDNEKFYLRSYFFRKRAEFSTDQKSQSVIRNLLDFFKKKSIESFALYASYKSEVNTIPFIQRTISKDEMVILPRIVGKKLSFFKIFQWSSDYIEKSSFGFWEPLPNKNLEVALEQLDAVVVPGLAFDRLGGRLGYGGGFYDRTFLGHFDTILVGIAFQEQLVDSLPTTSFDRNVDFLITDN